MELDTLLTESAHQAIVIYTIWSISSLLRISLGAVILGIILKICSITLLLGISLGAVILDIILKIYDHFKGL